MASEGATGSGTDAIVWCLGLAAQYPLATAARAQLAALVAAAQRAGARDVPLSFAAFVAWLGREGLSICAWEEFEADRRLAEQVPGELRPLEPTAVLERWLDALRAGGAGT